MGQKVDPRGLRLGITRTWDSNWFAEGEAYLNFFHEDVKVRNFVKDKYNHAGISSVKIERTSSERIVVIINTAKAGILIGRKGQEIENLRVALEKLTGKKVVVPDEFKEIANEFKGKKSGTFEQGLESITIWMKSKGMDTKNAKWFFIKLLGSGINPSPFLYPAYVTGKKNYQKRLEGLLKSFNKKI